MVWHPTASLGQGLVALGWAETGSGCLTDLLQRAGPLPYSLPCGSFISPCQSFCFSSLAKHTSVPGSSPTEAIKQNLSRAEHCEWMSCTSTSPSVIACEWLHNTHSCRIVPGKPSVSTSKPPSWFSAGQGQGCSALRHLDAGNSAPFFRAEVGARLGEEYQQFIWLKAKHRFRC